MIFEHEMIIVVIDNQLRASSPAHNFGRHAGVSSRALPGLFILFLDASRLLDRLVLRDLALQLSLRALVRLDEPMKRLEELRGFRCFGVLAEQGAHVVVLVFHLAMALADLLDFDHCPIVEILFISWFVVKEKF